MRYNDTRTENLKRGERLRERDRQSVLHFEGNNGTYMQRRRKQGREKEKDRLREIVNRAKSIPSGLRNEERL